MSDDEYRGFLSWFRLCEYLILHDRGVYGFKDFREEVEDLQQCPGMYALDQSTSECVQPIMSVASSDTFVDVCTSVESTLAGVDVDAVSGPVVIHLLMCVQVLNQH